MCAPQWLISLALVATVLAGCSPDPAPQGGAAPPAAEQTPAPSKTTIAVAAASDLKFALDEVIAEFGKGQPHIEVKATYGSSGNFFAQLSNEAPFDIFFSADIDYPRKLIEQGQALKESEFQYAIGHLVVWVRSDSAIDLEKDGLKALADPAVRKIAIANPKHAPYGRAAEAALKHFGVYEQIVERLVLGENVAQTAQFVESGAADAGIIALSLALAPAMRDKGRYHEVPLDAYPTLEQGGVILARAKDREATEKLRSFVMTEPGRAILKRYGFLLPGD